METKDLRAYEALYQENRPSVLKVLLSTHRRFYSRYPSMAGWFRKSKKTRLDLWIKHILPALDSEEMKPLVENYLFRCENPYLWDRLLKALSKKMKEEVLEHLWENAEPCGGYKFLIQGFLEERSAKSLIPLITKVPPYKEVDLGSPGRERILRCTLHKNGFGVSFSDFLKLFDNPSKDLRLSLQCFKKPLTKRDLRLLMAHARSGLVFSPSAAILLLFQQKQLTDQEVLTARSIAKLYSPDKGESTFYQMSEIFTEEAIQEVLTESRIRLMKSSDPQLRLKVTLKN